MQITAFTGFSKRINSTKQPTGGTAIECVLKSPTSVIRPTFRITGFNLGWNYIQWGTRYYFVEDITILTNDIAEYSCALDVLATYKSDIGASTEYVTRAASSYDLAITDMNYPTKSEVSYHDLSIDQINNQISVSGGTYVLGIKSNHSSTGVSFYALTVSQFEALVDYMYSDVWLDATDVTKALQKMLIDPFDYIISVNWYPFDVVSPSVSSVQLYFGYWAATGVTGKPIRGDDRIKTLLGGVTLPQHPQVSRGAYLNGAPYTQIYIDLFAFGRFPVDANMFLESRQIVVSIGIDIFTGVGTLSVYNNHGAIYKASATCSVPVQLSQVKNDLVTPVLAGASAIKDISSKDYLGAASNVADAVKSAMPQISTVGSVGSITAYAYNPSDVQMVWYEIIDEDLATMGRPLCQPKQISTLSGYILCENVDLATVGTPAEKKQIIDFMESGFYYE